MYSSPARQRSVIEFLTAEGEMPIRIHERLKNVYGDATVDVSTVRRWVRRCKEGKRPCGSGSIPVGSNFQSVYGIGTNPASWGIWVTTDLWW